MALSGLEDTFKSGFIPLTLINSEALIFMFPASPSANEEEEIDPPFLIRNCSVSIFKLPALPALKEEAEILDLLKEEPPTNSIEGVGECVMLQTENCRVLNLK
jgi:hypothetical protein